MGPFLMIKLFNPEDIISFYIKMCSNLDSVIESMLWSNGKIINKTDNEKITHLQSQTQPRDSLNF